MVYTAQQFERGKKKTKQKSTTTYLYIYVVDICHKYYSRPINNVAPGSLPKPGIWNHTYLYGSSFIKIMLHVVVQLYYAHFTFSNYV